MVEGGQADSKRTQIYSAMIAPVRASAPFRDATYGADLGFSSYFLERPSAHPAGDSSVSSGMDAATHVPAPTKVSK